MTDKQIIEEDMVNAKDFCPHYSCQVDCYEARMCQWFVDTLQQLQAKEEECEKLKEENFTFEQLIKEIEKHGAIEEILQQLDQLKAENEALKKSVRSNKDKRKRAIEKYIRLKEFTDKNFNQFEIDMEKAENKRLKQILQEIKEICKQKLPAGLSAPSCYESFEAFTGYILQKSEVLDEKI